MSGARYICCDEQRRADLLSSGPAGMSGIDYVEVEAGATTADPTIIEIVLVKPWPLPSAALTGVNISITGGVRFRPPTIAPTVELVPAAGPVASYKVTIPGNQLTDFSTYRLAIVTSATDPSPPKDFDPRLAAVDINFKVACPSDFDCEPCAPDDETPVSDATFDYRTRDYSTFRQQLLDRMVELVPDFGADDAADLTTTLIEAAAYTADQLSYRLDWIGTEAFLQTARSRASIARHARLLDYRINEGVSARTFVQFRFTPGQGFAVDGMVLPLGTPLLVRRPDLPAQVDGPSYARVLPLGPIVFETAAPLALWEWRNLLPIYTWSDEECRLARGATAATLVQSDPGAPALGIGDFVLFQEIASPDTGQEEDADPERRHVVRITGVTILKDPLDPLQQTLADIEWDEEDALPFDLIVQAKNPDASAGAKKVVCAAAAANVIIADQGASLPPAGLSLSPSDETRLAPKIAPAAPPADGPWRPEIAGPPIAYIDPVNLAVLPLQSATFLSLPDSSRAEPALFLQDDFGEWTARRDLLSSGRFDRDFVIETSIEGRVELRFGDDINGLEPSPGAEIAPHGRFGTGPEGNLGSDSISHVVLADQLMSARIVPTNPLPARGGVAPEPASAIRIAAPQAFRIQERAVSEADYAAAAKQYPDVDDAVATARWTGAWQTMLVYIDRKEGRPVDSSFARGVAGYLESFRLMGFDVAVRGAKPAPLDIQILVCVEPGALRNVVASRVRDALRPIGPGGNPGFFHPDHFTFGSPLYASALIAAVMAIEGVRSVELLRFQRFGRLAQNELAQGIIRPAELEVLQLSDDPNFPEQGRLSLVTGGGR